MPWGLSNIAWWWFVLFSKKGKGASSEELSPGRVRGKSPSFFSVHLSILSCFPYYSAKKRQRETLKMKPVFPNEIILSEDTIVRNKNSRFFIVLLNSKSISPCFSHKTRRRDPRREGN